MSLSKGQSSPVPGTPETKKKESAVFAMISGTGELSGEMFILCVCASL